MKFISKQGRLKATKSLLVSISARELKWWLLIQSRGYALKELITRGWAQYRWRIIIREGTFFIGGGGGGAGASERRVLSKFFTNWGVSNLFYSQLRGRVIVFLARKKLLHVTSILYIQAKLPVKINLNYLQVSKNLYIKNYLLPTNIIVSVDPCPLSPIFWCFRAGFCDLLLSKPRELPTGAFFQSRNSGESVPCRDKWSKRTGRILAEYYLRIQYIRPLGWGTTLGLHLSTSLDLRFHLFPQPMCHQQSQRSSGHPF